MLFRLKWYTAGREIPKTYTAHPRRAATRRRVRYFEAVAGIHYTPVAR